MKDGLAVAANQRDALGQDSKFAASGKRGVGKDFSQSKIQLAKSARSNGLLLSHAQNLFAKRGRKSAGGMDEQLSVQIRRRSGDACERNVNAIGGRARHHPENQHRFVAHEICFFSSASRLSASSGFN